MTQRDLFPPTRSPVEGEGDGMFRVLFVFGFRNVAVLQLLRSKFSEEETKKPAGRRQRGPRGHLLCPLRG